MPILSWIEDSGSHENFDLDSLKVDECYLKLTNLNNVTIYLNHVYEECQGCNKQKLSDYVGPLSSTNLILNTKHPISYGVVQQFFNESYHIIEEELCSLKYEDLNFGEFGIYEVNVTNDTCKVNQLKEDVSIYFPIITIVLIYLALYLVAVLIKSLWNLLKFERLDILPLATITKPALAKNRVISLDAFRGISIVVMIFVNYGGGGYYFTDHAIWNGLYIADLVFPWFMWIMGVCIPISINSVLKKGVSRTKIVRNIITRSFKLFLIGVFLNTVSDLETMRIFGVLQRFAICYLVVAILNVALMSREQIKEKPNSFRHLQSVIILKFQWLCAFLILVAYLLLLFLLQEPTCPRGYLGPGGLDNNGKYINCTGGATGYVDRVILGEHMYQFPTIKTVFQSTAFDPEGILGCMPSIFQVFLGVQAGTVLLTDLDHLKRIINWLIWSVLTGLVGGALCGFSKNDGIIPVNKNLWSLSYILVTTSFACILLSICYILIDWKKLWMGKPFIFAGTNAIMMYIGHNMVYTNFPFHWQINARLARKSHFIMLTENMWATGLWVLVAYWLWRKRIFITI